MFGTGGKKFVNLHTRKEDYMARSLKNSTKRHSIILAHIGALLCIIMWGTSFVSTKVLLNYGMQPVEIYIYRFILAYLVVMLIGTKRLLSNNWRDEGLLALCGVLSGSIYFLAENFALEYTLVTNVSLLTSLSPLITALLIGIWYRNERPGSGMIIGSIVAFVGVGCVIFNSSFNVQVNPLGDLLSLSAAVSFSFYSIILNKLNAVYDVWFITRKTFFYGILTALPFLAIEHPALSLHQVFTMPGVYGNIIFLGIGASMLGFVLWASTVKSMGAVKANNYLYVQPIITLVVSAILLGEHVSVIGCTGCALILVGLWLGDRLTLRQKMKG